MAQHIETFRGWAETVRQDVDALKNVLRIVLAMLAATASFAATFVASGTATAGVDDTFDAAAAGALRFEHLDGIIWTATEPCKTGDVLAQRQCRLVRDARRAELAGALLMYESDSSPVTLGAFDAGTKSATVSVSACISCTDVDGKTAYVVGNDAPPTIRDGLVSASQLVETAQAFNDEGVAAAWTKRQKRLRVQYLFKLPATAAWERNGVAGIAVTIVGYRVFDPCDGTVVTSMPKSERVAGDKRRCKLAAGDDEVDTTPKETIYDHLSSAQIQGAMKPVIEAADACFARFGEAGGAKLHMVVGGNGAVLALKQAGDFAGKETGMCIEAAVRGAKFPSTHQTRTTIDFPLMLR